MQWSRLLTTVQAAEGFSAVPYWDNDQWTYGYGCKAPEKEGYISKEEAAALLLEELIEAEKDARVLFPAFDSFEEPRQEALVEMAFNLGRTKLLKFRNTLNAINADPPRWADAADHALASRWATQVKGRAVRIAEVLRTGVAA